MSLKTALLHNVMQRQRAAWVATAWDAGDPTNVAKLVDVADTPGYSEAQVRAYLNAVSTAFIDESTNWDEGATAVPTFYSGSYFDSGDATFEAILAKCMTLARTVVAWTPYGPPYPAVWQGVGAGNSVDEAVAAAASDWKYASSDAVWYASGKLEITGGPAVFQANATKVCGNIAAAGIPAVGVSATARFLVRTTAWNGGYDSQGEAWVGAEGEYCEVVRHAVAANETGFTALDPMSDRTFPSNVGPGGAGSGEFGFMATTDPRWVLEWNFDDWAGRPSTGDYDEAQVHEGRVVISRQSGEDEIYQWQYDLVTETAGWVHVTRAAEDFPAAPENGQTDYEADYGIEWTYVAALDKWRAAYGGRGFGDLRTGVRIRRVAIPAGCLQYVFELPTLEVPMTDYVLSVIPAATWTTSLTVSAHTHRSAVIDFGTAPAYPAELDVLFSSVTEWETYEG